jgi:hypothetical protein
MDLCNVQWVVNLVPAHNFLSLNVYDTSNAANETSCPEGYLVTGGGHTDEPGKHSVTQLMHIVVVHGLPLVNLCIVTKHIVVLVAN